MITIKTQTDFQKILNNPRLYAIISLFSSMNFTYDYTEEYSALVQSLSIKNRRKRIKFIYENACNKISKYNDEHNICCYFTNSRCERKNAYKVNGCCCHCIYQSLTGCPTENLTCKLFFCEKIQELKPLKFNDFPEFNLLSAQQKYIIRNNIYCKKETYLRLLYANSYLLFFLRSTLNLPKLFMGDRINKKLEQQVDKNLS